MNREKYKAIKKYDRQQMENFIGVIYTEGYKAGAVDNTKVDYQIDLVRILKGVKGVGEKTIEKILLAVREEM